MSLTRAGIAPLALVFALCGILTQAEAQQAPPAPAPTAPAPAAPAPGASAGLTILVVDVQSLLQNSKSAKMVRQQIEQKRAEYAKEISHQEEVLRQERDTLQRQQASLSAEALNQKGKEFQQKVNDLDRGVQGKRQALERSNADALEKIQEAMLKIVTEISKDRKANLVFQRSELVLFDQGFDVTDEVLQKLDEQMPTLTVNFVAPVTNSASGAQPAAQPGAQSGDHPAAAPATPAPKKKK
jgi:outer membrane protein